MEAWSHYNRHNSKLENKRKNEDLKEKEQREMTYESELNGKELPKTINPAQGGYKMKTKCIIS